MLDRVPVITIDGPSSSGKGTLARLVKSWLGWHLLDSGSLYRLVALEARRGGTDFEDEAALAAVAGRLRAEFVDEKAETKLVLRGRDVTDELRSEACGTDASSLAAYPAVRAALLERQRAFLEPPGLVADGRDMGTVVFPHADLKIYLTASTEERARRRYKQLKQKGMSVNLAQLLGDIAERDRRDKQRTVSPLKPATDAVLFDTTRLDVSAVEDQIKRLVRDIGLASSTRFKRTTPDCPLTRLGDEDA